MKRYIVICIEDEGSVGAQIALVDALNGIRSNDLLGVQRVKYGYHTDEFEKRLY